MGLDSTLYKRHLIRGNNVKVSIEIDGKPCETINLEAIGTIVEEVAYWRKASHIHNWFVENVKEGADNPRPYIVERLDLLKLLKACKEVKENPQRAEELLPCTDEPFCSFGEDYDERYFKIIDETIVTLENILKDKSVYRYEYHSIK